MKKKVLIIDDAEELVELTTRLLTTRGYDVISLNSGEEDLTSTVVGNPRSKAQ